MTTRRSRAATRQRWSERIDRFDSSTDTIAQFCAAEGCSQASFYQWRRKLRSDQPKLKRQRCRSLPRRSKNMDA